MNKDQYNEWRNHPATLFFRQFLKDRRAALITAATESWLNGSVAFEKENQFYRGQIDELFAVENVPFEAIEAFYQERENGAQDSEAVPD